MSNTTDNKLYHDIDVKAMLRDNDGAIYSIYHKKAKQINRETKTLLSNNEYKTDKETIEKESYPKRLKTALTYGGFCTASISPSKESLQIFPSIEKERYIEQFINKNALSFNIKQVFELTYMLKHFPFAIVEHNITRAMSQADENIGLLERLYPTIKKNYHLDNLGYETLTDYTAHIVHMFNTTDRMHVSDKQYSHITDTLHFVDNVPIAQTMNILYGETFSDDNSEFLLNASRPPRLDALTYNETLDSIMIERQKKAMA